MKKILTLITAFVILMIMTSCGSSVSDRALQKLLKENGYEYEDCEVKKIYSLPKELKNFENDKNNKLVLFEDDDDYGYAILNTKKKRLVIPRISNIPLDIVQKEIYQNDMDINTRCIEVYKKYIENNGIYCFEDKAIAEAYLREITGVSGILPTTTAQNAIKNQISTILPEAASAASEIIFENSSAVPMYYALQNGASWTAYDSNMGIVQVFNTKEELDNILKSNSFSMQTGPVPNTPTQSPADTANNSATQPLYFVRTSFSNTSTQKGAFVNIQNAKTSANENAGAGYKVYDVYGTMVYDPSPAPTPTPSVPEYYVRKSANDTSSQVGAFNVLQYAKNQADTYKYSGYEVYDKYGNLIYDPYVDSSSSYSSSSSSGVGTKVVNGCRYRVRKSANDSQSQIGAYADLDNAKALANKNKSAGYKVYDMEGTLVYVP